MSPTYKPTAGMLRALTVARGADELDYARCRQRGLIGRNNLPTPKGHGVIAHELQRRRDLGHG